MGSSIGSLVIDLSANTAKFDTDMKRAAKIAAKQAKEIESENEKTAKAVKLAAIAVVAGLGLMIKKSIDAADQFNDLSKSTGVSVESLSQLQYAAKQSGTDLEGLTAGLRKFNSTIADAANGVKGPKEALDALGISAKNTDGSLKGTEELLLQVAEQFSQYADGAGKAALAQDLFGKSGTTLIPFLNEGRAGLEALKNEANDLGLTISGQTAAAADAFNDSLGKLAARAAGFGNQLATQLLPTLQAITDSTIDASQASIGFGQAVVSVVGGGFKTLVDVGSRVAETFEDVGNALGAIAAAAVQVAKGEFSQAYNIIKEANADALAREEEYNAFRQKIWVDTATTIVDTAKAADQELKKTLIFGGKGGGGLEEFTPNIKKIETSGLEDYYDRLNDLTKTSTEQAVSAYEEQKAAINELYRAGIISAEQFYARSKEAIDTLLPEFEVTAKRIKIEADKTTSEIDEFQKAVAQNSVSIIADTLTSGFEDGARGVIKAFGDMLLDLAAQAVAADIARKIFGDTDKGQSGGSGWLGALVGLFGGGRATGGPVSAGTMYRVNETQPEFFKPNSSGQVIPLSKMGSNGQITNHFVIQAPQGTVSRQTQLQIAAAASRGISNGSRRNN